MNCSADVGNARSDVPLVREGGVQYVPAAPRDGLRALDELMDVVEALCPRWPVRHASLAGARFVL